MYFKATLSRILDPQLTAFFDKIQTLSIFGLMPRFRVRRRVPLRDQRAPELEKHLLLIKILISQILSPSYDSR